MFVEIAPSVYQAALLALLSACVSMATKSVEIEPWSKHDAANVLVDKLLGVGKYDVDNVCDEAKRDYAATMKYATEVVADVYQRDGHDADAAAEKIKEGYIAAGQSGVVFLVKVGNEKRAMKITACGYLQEEIYAQEKLASEPWVIKMHSWGRSSGDKPKWEYYIMDLIGATVENAYNDKGNDKGKIVSDEQMREAIRLTLEAARLLHTKYNLAHMDLKSDNLAFMANDPTHVKLIDFGLVAPLTNANAIAAYVDYWRIIETIKYHSDRKAFSIDGAKTLFKILEDEAATQILDGMPFAAGTNDFPKKAFFDTYLYGKVMDKLVDLKWINSKSKGNPDTVLKTLFSKDKLPAVKFNPLINQ